MSGRGRGFTGYPAPYGFQDHSGSVPIPMQGSDMYHHGSMMSAPAAPGLPGAGPHSFMQEDSRRHPSPAQGRGRGEAWHSRGAQHQRSQPALAATQPPPPPPKRAAPSTQSAPSSSSAPAAAEPSSNDYCQHYVDTGHRPQNYLRDSQLSDLYAEYPKMRQLVDRKAEVVEGCATPPYLLQADLRELPLTVDTFGTKFDVVLVDPPWEEYVRRAPGLAAGAEVWGWQEIRDLAVESITDTPSVCFLWCGCEEGLEAGRHCLAKWGFRRVEEVCWVKTNLQAGGRKYLGAAHQDQASVLVHTKEHCLVGLKGSVKRRADGHIVHANVDTDIIISEEPPLGSTAKPEELYGIIERFWMGRRRLELFGEQHNARPGWVTVGKSVGISNFSAQQYASHFALPSGQPYRSHRGRPQAGNPALVPHDELVEELRPRSPPGRS